MHGGVIASLIDMAGLFSILATGQRPRGTADLHVDYLASARQIDVIANATPVKIGRRISIATVNVTDAAGQRLAIGRGAYIMRNAP